jgi:hypothetical protein
MRDLTDQERLDIINNLMSALSFERGKIYLRRYAKKAQIWTQTKS